MKPIAMASLAGDQAAYHKLHDYLARIATPADSPPDSPQEPDSSDPESDDQHDDALSDQDSAHQPSALRVPSNGVNKRKQASPSDDETSSNHQDSDASDDIPKDARAITAKRVKISQRVDSIDAEQAQSDSNQSEDKDNDDRDPSLSGEATSDDDDDDDENDNDDNDDDGDDEDDDEEPAFFAGAESSSEFGDVDEGEAELERLLALAEGGDPESDEDGTAEDDDDEPQSFSRIPPHELHRVLNVPDDPPTQPSPRTARPRLVSRTVLNRNVSPFCPAVRPPSRFSSSQVRCSTYPPAGTTRSPPPHHLLPPTNALQPRTAQQSRAKSTWRSTIGSIRPTLSSSSPSNRGLPRAALQTKPSYPVSAWRSAKAPWKTEAVAPAPTRDPTAMQRSGMRSPAPSSSRSKSPAIEPGDAVPPRACTSCIAHTYEPRIVHFQTHHHHHIRAQSRSVSPISVQ